MESSRSQSMWVLHSGHEALFFAVASISTDIMSRSAIKSSLKEIPMVIMMYGSLIATQVFVPAARKPTVDSRKHRGTVRRKDGQIPEFALNKHYWVSYESVRFADTSSVHRRHRENYATRSRTLCETISTQGVESPGLAFISPHSQMMRSTATLQRCEEPLSRESAHSRHLRPTRRAPTGGDSDADYW